MYNTDLASGMGTDYFLQMIVALVLVLAVIVLLSFLVKRFSLFTGTSTGPIKVLSGISLGGKDRLLLVQVGKEQLLLGTSPGNIQKLHKLRDPIAPELLAGTRLAEADKQLGTDKGQSRINFASILNSVSRG